MTAPSYLSTLDRFSFYHLKFFQLLGFFPLSTHGEPRSSLLLTLWSLILISINFLKACLMYYHSDYLILADDIVGKLHDVANMTSITITHNIILVESFLRRDRLRRFFIKLRTLRDQYPVKCGHRTHFLWELYAFIVYIIIFEWIFYDVITDDLPLITVWSLNLWSHIPALLHYFQSILFLELVRLELVKLNKSLKDIIVFTTSQDGAGSRGIFKDYLKKRIVKTQKRYQIIYGMVQELNEFFGLSWAIGVVNTAVTSEILFYWVYWGLHFGIFYNAVGKKRKS